VLNTEIFEEGEITQDQLNTIVKKYRNRESSGYSTAQLRAAQNDIRSAAGQAREVKRRRQTSGNSELQESFGGIPEE
jgi:hypothetical protein